MFFRKMHGLGNDFVVLDARKEALDLTPAAFSHIADRHFGVGCDTVVVLEKSEKADVFARYFNADGSESGACGNATRCVADIIMTESGKDSCLVEVTYGVLPCRKTRYLEVEVDMGAPKSVSDLDLSHGGVSNPVTVDMGNPHCVFFVDNVGDIDVLNVGPYVENHAAFPSRTNVEFVQNLGSGRLRQKTWERGSGLTLACGSGACAVITAAIHRGIIENNKAEIVLDGGTLYMEQRAVDGHILMRGGVAYVFEGTLIHG